MPCVIYVPGFSASELSFDRFGSDVFWCNYSRVVVRGLEVMRLSDDGEQPGGSSGALLFPTAVLTPYWGPISELLTAQLQPAGYAVRVFPWDWRQSILSAGERLAAEVELLPAERLPAVFVAHSAGGLVARAAWAKLRADNRHQRLRRIVAVATPNCGTYYAVNSFSGVSEFVAQVVALANVIGGPFGAALAGFYATWGAAQVVDVCLTWPCLYQLLPVVGASDAAGDPNRSYLYDGAEWHGLPAPISARHLQETRDVFHAFLLDPASRPPAEVMTCVSGTGYDTPYTLGNPALLGFPQALGHTQAGDGVVTTASAEDGFPIVLRVTGRHSDIPWALASSGQLASLILDERTPATSPRSTTVDPYPIPVVLGGPPIPALSLAGLYDADCYRGRCGC